MTTADPSLLSPALVLRRQADRVLGPVIDMGNSDMRIGAVVGIACAALIHGFMIFSVFSALHELDDWTRKVRKQTAEFNNAFAEIDMSPVEPKEEKEEKKVETPPPPEPEPQPVVDERPPEERPVVQQVAHKPQVENTPPPSTNPYEDDEPPKPSGGGGTRIDFSANGAGGWNGGDGNGNGTGTGNGTGPGSGSGPPGTAKPVAPPPPQAPPAADLSKPPTLVGSKSWNCPFPPEADAEGKDSAVVQLIVTVGSDGSAEKVSVIADPGSGFGRAARGCALGRRYQAGLDRDGKPTRKATAPITVRFTR